VEKKAEEKKVVEEFIPTGPNFFHTKLTSELIHAIFDFLDPVSLAKVGLLCKEFYQVTHHPLLYKKFCTKLYHSLPPLPKNSPFQKVVQALNQSTYGEYPAWVISQANKDVRSLIWIPELKHYYTPPSYYKEFKNFKGVFFNAPRVNHHGVYVMKAKYIRPGTRDLSGFYDPYHVIEFYRYFRFLPDGLVISCLSVNKLKAEKIVEIFSAEADQSNPFDEDSNKNNYLKSLLYGEYIIQKNIIHVRVVSKTTIYEFELEIDSTIPGLFDTLKLLSQTMRTVGSETSTPLANDFRGSKTFKFVKVKELLNDIHKDIAVISI